MKIPLVGLSTGKTKVSVEAEGFNGVGCKAATEVFENAIGVSGVCELKAEYYEQPPQQEEHTKI